MNSTTWYEVEQAIQRWAKDDWLSGYYSDEDDNVERWAHETADGCEYTIYYRHQNDLWADSAYVQSFEDMVYGAESVQDTIQACVYYAIYEKCLEAAYEVMEIDSVLATTTKDKRIRTSTGESVTIPVLATTRVPRKP